MLNLTKGNWTVYQTNNEAIIYSDINPFTFLASIGGDLRVSQKEVIDNAKLMAIAPKLLKVLNTLVDYNNSDKNAGEVMQDSEGNLPMNAFISPNDWIKAYDEAESIINSLYGKSRK